MARPDQTEKATPKRRADARERGQVARSADVGGAAIFLVIIISLHVAFVPTLVHASEAFVVAIQQAGHVHAINIHSVWGLFARAFGSFVSLLGVAFFAAVGVALLANWLQFGFLFLPSKLVKWNFKTLNPLPGLKRVFFSPQTLVNLAKQLAKLAIVIVLVFMSIQGRLPMFYALAHASPFDMVRVIEDLVFWIGVKFGVLLLVLGIADYAWEKRQLAQSLKMTKTEVKDEQRQQDSSPEIKAQVKQRQRAAARRRMMAAVPRATVVVTNPTHFAVALEWDEIKMDAPVLTAKGADLMARRIRELAREHNVPILENPPLARTLYDKVELDSPVPPDLYAAVAQIIAFVYRLKNKTIA